MVSTRSEEAPRVWRIPLPGACGVLLIGIVVTEILWNMSLPSMFHNSQNELGNEDDDKDRVPLAWEEAAEAPVARLDGAAVQIAHLLYVFAGYAKIDEVVLGL